MVRWLTEQGHEVCVVTTPPYYPEWRIHRGYSGGAYAREVWHRALVIRCPLWVPRQPSGLKRIVHLATFALSSMPIMLRLVVWRPQVVWVVEPALLTAPLALAVARLAGARSWLHIQDYEVDAAFAMGLIRGEKLKRAVQTLERWTKRRFDVVSTISRRMLALAAAKGVDADKLVLFPNWVDISGIVPLKRPSSYREQLGLSRDSVIALYSGNMGNKQGLEVLAEAARLLRGDPRIRFVFCGDGAGKEKLVRACEGLSNVSILPLQPADRVSELLGLADIHLLPQLTNAADLVLPSKLTGMLASGRPVIVSADRQTELGQVVEHSGCGVLVKPEDAEALADAICHLAAEPSWREVMGAAGRAYAEREFDVHTIMQRFSERLLT